MGGHSCPIVCSDTKKAVKSIKKAAHPLIVNRIYLLHQAHKPIVHNLRFSRTSLEVLPQHPNPLLKSDLGEVDPSQLCVRYVGSSLAVQASKSTKSHVLANGKKPKANCLNINKDLFLKSRKAAKLAVKNTTMLLSTPITSSHLLCARVAQGHFYLTHCLNTRKAALKVESQALRQSKSHRFKRNRHQETSKIVQASTVSFKPHRNTVNHLTPKH